MKTYKRAERVKHLIQQEISRILQHDVKDPRVKFVTVTEVKLTPDLRDARVLVTTLGDVTDREALLTGLKRATGYIRGELGRRLKLKYTPSVEFRFDDSFDKQERIFHLLEHIQHEHEEGEPE
jgi:ribosome-binding factor A